MSSIIDLKDKIMVVKKFEDLKPGDIVLREAYVHQIVFVEHTRGCIHCNTLASTGDPNFNPNYVLLNKDSSYICMVDKISKAYRIIVNKIEIRFGIFHMNDISTDIRKGLEKDGVFTRIVKTDYDEHYWFTDYVKAVEKFAVFSNYLHSYKLINKEE